MARLRVPFSALACLLALSGAASAQTERPLRASYEDQLEELGRVLGGSHYLRILCAGRGDQRWRDAMRGVLAREPAQRGRLTSAFNEGYRREEARFPVCDRGAEQTEAELRAQGLRLANALSVRNAGDGARR
ncbi:MAG: TIGR02301 family protein [Hyphomonadaceae bacterium]